MKKKHLKLGSCALMASLLTLSSCVDNDYDLTKDIELKGENLQFEICTLSKWLSGRSP